MSAAAPIRGFPAQAQITHLATIAFVSGTNWLLLASAATVTAGALCAFCFLRSPDLVHAAAPHRHPRIISQFAQRLRNFSHPLSLSPRF